MLPEWEFLPHEQWASRTCWLEALLETLGLCSYLRLGGCGARHEDLRYRVLVNGVTISNYFTWWKAIS